MRTAKGAKTAKTAKKKSVVGMVLSAFLLLAIGSAVLADEQVPSTGGQRRVNTWAARSSSGVTLGGTWTLNEGQNQPNAASGTWTLLDAQGRAVATGGWSAAKSSGEWTGRWRAATVGRPGEYTGTWTAKVDLKPAAPFADLFAKAIEAAVSGTFRTGAQSGAWTIRVSAS